MKILILVLVLLLAGGWCSGYRLHPENVSYYVSMKNTGAKSELRLLGGQTLSGVIEEETEDSVKFNMDGAMTVFKKTEIESIKTAASTDFISALKKNYEDNHVLHPLVTHRKEDTLMAKWDYAVLEPSRIAEDMKKKNPGLSAVDSMNDAMAASARARQQAYKQRKAMEEAAAGN